MKTTINSKQPVNKQLECVIAEQYLTSLDAQGYSLHTRNSYRSDLKKFEIWLHQEGNVESKNAHEASAQDISGWVMSASVQGLSPTTIRRRLAALRSMLKFATQLGYVADNQGQVVKSPKIPKTLPKNLDLEKVEAVFTVLEQEAENGDWIAIRDLAMCELLYSSGLRLAELVSCDVTSLDLGSKIVTVMGKGGKERQLPIGRKALQSLQSWLRIRSDKVEVYEPALFIGSQGTRITARNVQLRISGIGQRSGIGSIFPHQFRHSFASHMLQSSGDLRAVQELLGHVNIATTQVYTALDWAHLAKSYDSAHPRSKIKKRTS